MVSSVPFQSLPVFCCVYSSPHRGQCSPLVQQHTPLGGEGRRRRDREEQKGKKKKEEEREKEEQEKDRGEEKGKGGGVLGEEGKEEE